MSNRIIIILDSTIRTHAESVIHSLPADGSMEIVIREHKPNRSLDQNSKLWAMLGEISAQVNWYGNKLTSENWKDVFTASLKKQTVVPGIDGGFVVCGTSTRKMSRAEMSELIELMEAFGVDHDVKFQAGADENKG